MRTIPIPASIQEHARRFGLSVATWQPGDGQTRYRVFVGRQARRYHDGDGLITLVGAREAYAYVCGYADGLEWARRIAEILDGREWSADTLDAIAAVLREAGFTVGEPR